MPKTRPHLLESYSTDWSEDSIRLFPYSSPEDRSLFLYVQEIGYFQTFPGYYTKRENLNSFLILSTVSGSGSLQYHGNQYDLTAGSAFLINCQDLHHYYCTSREPWSFYWVHFTGIHALGYYELIARNQNWVLHESEYLNVQSLLKTLFCSHRDNLSALGIQSNLLLSQLITEFLLATPSAGEKSTGLSDTILNLQKYLERHFLESPSLDQMSHDLGISKFHLSREFKKQTGFTIHQYLIHLKISAAKELLQYSKASIYEICFLCGFRYPSHFIRQFQDAENMTPKEYRLNWQNKSPASSVQTE